MRCFVMIIVYRGVDGEDDHHVQKTVFLKNSILRDKTIVHKITFQVNLKIYQEEPTKNKWYFQK